MRVKFYDDAERNRPLAESREYATYFIGECRLCPAKFDDEKKLLRHIELWHHMKQVRTTEKGTPDHD